MERILMGSLELTVTTTGKPAVDLYAADTRLRFPELRLFDLAMLAQIGIDPNALEPRARHHQHFYAVYTVSDKLNQHGNPYRDVIRLEAIDAPATTASTDTAALLAELRAIKALLLHVIETATAPGQAQISTTAGPNDAYQELRKRNRAEYAGICPDCKTQPCICAHLVGQPDTAATGDDLDDHFPRYSDGTPLGPTPAERGAYDLYRANNDGAAPLNVDALRAWYRAHAED